MTNYLDLKDYIDQLEGQVNLLSQRKLTLQNEITALVRKLQRVQKDYSAFSSEQILIALSEVKTEKDRIDAEFEQSVVKLQSLFAKADLIREKEIQLSALEAESANKAESAEFQLQEAKSRAKKLDVLVAEVQTMSQTTNLEFALAAEQKGEAEKMYIEASDYLKTALAKLAETDSKVSYLTEIVNNELRFIGLRKQLLDEREKVLDNREKEIKDQFNQLIKAKKYIDERS